MPLIKSKSPKGQGDMDAQESKGKPSIAIALSVQRQAKKKKMAQGGEVKEHNDEHAGMDSGVHCKVCDGACMMADGGPVKPPQPTPTPTVGDIIHYPKGASMAQGGAVASGASNDADEHYDSIADAIMRKRQAKKMADGGGVDSNDEETPAMLSPFDDENAEAAMKENYGPQGQFHDQPEDSNEMGDEREDETSDKHDMVSAVRKKMKMRILGQRS